MSNKAKANDADYQLAEALKTAAQKARGQVKDSASTVKNMYTRLDNSVSEMLQDEGQKYAALGCDGDVASAKDKVVAGLKVAHGALKALEASHRRLMELEATVPTVLALKLKEGEVANYADALKKAGPVAGPLANVPLGKASKSTKLLEKAIGKGAGEDEEVAMEGGVSLEARIKCPISMSIMSDPVKTHCNHTFDRASITDILSKKGGTANCPAAGCDKAVKLADLEVNENIVDDIAKFHRRKQKRKAEEEEEEEEEQEEEEQEEEEQERKGKVGGSSSAKKGRR